MELKKSVVVGLMALGASSAFATNYGEALQKSIYFYEAQQSGPLPAWNRVEWRGDSAMTDGDDVGVDLTGGWYDAGDHVKFGFPMAATATMLAWGVVEYPEAYQQTNQMVHIKNNLRFVADYFVKAHTGPTEFWGQVGHGGDDHKWWGSAEVLPMARPSFKIDAANPGSDLAGETAAALSAISMVFADSDPAYSAKLLEHARQLYDFAYEYRGVYSDAITDAQAYYNSWSGYQDELVWGAIWLYRATGENSYLDIAKTEYQFLSTEPQSDTRSYKWGQAWDDKSYGSYVLMAALTGEQEYRDDAERWLDYWTDGYQGDRISYTPGGLAFLDTWGAARYSSNTSFLALLYSDYLKAEGLNTAKAQTYYDFAYSQLEYILGNNPLGISYLIGYGDFHPTKPHHRTAHGAWNDSSKEPIENRHLLVGALVGGPGRDDSWEDDRDDYVKNEVATDYNAGFTSAVARLWLDHGGEPIDDSLFPQPEVRDTELYVDAKLNSQGPRHIEISARVHNHTAWPARTTDQLTMRYFVDLSEVIAAGYSAADVELGTAYDQGSGFTGPFPWGDPAQNLYYGEISFKGVNIFPGGQSDSKKEVQFRFALPSDNNNPDWDNSNDPSWDDYGSAHVEAPKIALYDAGVLVWGQEPAPACGADSGINCPPIADSQSVTTPFDTPASITLSASDSDGSIVGYQIATLPTNGSLTLSGAVASYVPNSGFFGNDSFGFVAEDDQGALSQEASVSIEVEAPIIPAVAISSPADGAQFPPAGNIDLQIDLANAYAAKVYVDSVEVTSRVGSGVVTIVAPDFETTIAVLVVAVDESGEALDAQAALSLDIVEGVEPPLGGLSCAPSVIDTWPGGFVINSVTVSNDSDVAVDGWKVLLSFDMPVSLANGWNAQLAESSDGMGITATNEVYNGSLPAGGSASFGLQGSYSGEFIAPSCTVLP
ncbi:glycoside hydrolase family 9 protein [Aliagarivorans marinus]|uniref:glycoside hydrolase family 9 protein n=1 Tax=Aliagarivorans marinus TaxID=561965 RepID=UPI0004275759|nr:glycoside hydrolase family 9 protein [Aliagarivorans marinus]